MDERPLPQTPREPSTVQGPDQVVDTISLRAGVPPSVASSVQKITGLGRYELLNVLGSGGFGTVFRAHDRSLRREVAIKVPRDGLLDRPQDVRRFLREAVTAAKLNHPNICRVYDLAEVDGTPFIVMSYIEGESLKGFLGRNKSLKPRPAVYAVYKLALALSEAHRQGIIHRDLKPSNVMVDAKRREPIILDFGLARHVDAKLTRLTISGEILGSPLYMSPEQVKGQSSQIGPATDIYSLGAILYEILVGSVPFHGSMAEVFGKILYEEPVPPSICRPGIPPDLDPICLRALAKSVDDRYPNMDSLVQSLASFLKAKEPGLQKAVPFSPSKAGMPVPGAELLPDPSPPPVIDWDVSAHRSTETQAACPRCRSPLPENSLLCSRCGFHRGMNQQFDVLAQDYVPPTEESSSWLKQQLETQETVGSFFLVAGGLLLLASVLLVGVLYQVLGIWSVLLLPAAFIGSAIVAGMLWGLPVGPNSILLHLKRFLAWRSMWHPTRIPKSLDMRDGQVTDDDLKKLKPEWGLEVLDLEGTHITDAGLSHLARLETLCHVVLRRTAVSPSGVDHLQQSVRKLRIWY